MYSLSSLQKNNNHPVHYFILSPKVSLPSHAEYRHGTLAKTIVLFTRCDTTPTLHEQYVRDFRSFWIAYTYTCVCLCFFVRYSHECTIHGCIYSLLENNIRHRVNVSSVWFKGKNRRFPQGYFVWSISN